MILRTAIPFNRTLFLNRVFLILVILAIPALTVAQEGGVVVFSKLIEGSVPGQDPMSPLWDEAKVVEFPLSAQVHWAPRQMFTPVKSVKVRSLHNGDETAILLEYQDKKQNATDAAAVEFPATDSKAHFAHGQEMMQVEGGPVNIWYWRSDLVQDMTAQGFGTLQVQDQQDVTGQGVWQDGVWRVAFSRKLDTGDPEDAQLIPGQFSQIAFAIWEGGMGDTGSKKAISSWWYFQAEPPTDRSIWIYTLLAVVVAGIAEMVLVRRLKKGSTNA